MAEMQALFRTAASVQHLGAGASVVNAFLHGAYLSNQQVAQDAAAMGIATVAIGNLNDLLWKPNVCNSVLHTHMPDFHTTEFLSEVGRQANGGAIYSRSFASGSLNCAAVLSNLANHLIVIGQPDVQKTVWEVFTGKTVDKLKPWH